MDRGKYNDIRGNRYTALAERQVRIGNLVLSKLPTGRCCIEVEEGYLTGYLDVLGIQTDQEFDDLVDCLQDTTSYTSLLTGDSSQVVFSNIYELGIFLIDHGYNIEYRLPTGYYSGPRLF